MDYFANTNLTMWFDNCKLTDVFISEFLHSRSENLVENRSAFLNDLRSKIRSKIYFLFYKQLQISGMSEFWDTNIIYGWKYFGNICITDLLLIYLLCTLFVLNE